MIATLPTFRAFRGTLVAFALGAAWLLCSVHVARAAITATPSRFVPAWGGESDATHVAWSNPVAGRVRVSVTTGTGAVRRVLVDEFETAGTHDTSWDGSDARGEPLAAGAYAIRVEHVGLQQTKRQGRAHAYAASGDDATVVHLEAAPLAIRTVRLVRGAIGSTKTHASIVGTYGVTQPAMIAAAIVDAQGRIVRSLASGAVGTGTSRVTWNGRTAAGSNVPDGAYTLLLSAASSGRPTATIRTPLRVDRHAPVVTTAARTRAATSRVRVLVPFTLSLNEAATVAVRVGRKHSSWRQAAGTSTKKLIGTALGIAPTHRARVVRVRVDAADATGNLSRRVIQVIVPAISAGTPVRHSSPPPPPAQTPPPPPTTTTTPPAGASGLIWPLDGHILITSPFGLRDRDFHEGIDINAATGTPVHAAADGTVLDAGTLGGYGIAVTLQNTATLSTRYAHMSRVAPGIVAGDHVTRGQLLGYSGCTGTCTGPHLHFEVRIAGIAKNALAYLPAAP